jgi:DNA polymerase-3 subunit epsilon
VNWLTRPLIAMDVETHDKVPPAQAHIVELGFLIMYPDEREPKRWCQLINPGVPIDPGATAVHSITNEDVKEAPLFSQLADNLAKGFTNCDYVGYNINFDLQVMQGEMDRAKVKWSYTNAHLFDPMHLWRVIEPRTLSDAVRRFLDREPTDAHRAIGDAEDALEVGLKLLELFPAKLPKDMKRLHDLAFRKDPLWIDSQGKLIWKGNEACINFGKHQGVALRLVPRSYLEWLAGSDFPTDTKLIIGDCLFGKFPSKSAT